MSNEHASEHASASIQRDFDPEGTLGEPDRSDDRERVIYEQHRTWGCPCRDCHPQLGPIADNY